jgi:cytochrome P450 family 6
MVTGPTVEVKEAMARFTTDVIASCAFGIDSNSLRNPDAEFRHYLRKVFGASALKQWAILMAFFPSSVRNLLRLQYLDDETSDFIRRTVWNTVEHR